MRYIIVLLVIFFHLQAIAQQTQKMNVDSLAKNTLNNLMDSWTLGIDSNSESVDIRIYNSFKNLFDSSAMIEDDINVFYVHDKGGMSGIYQTDSVMKPFDMFAHDVSLKLKGLIIEGVLVIDSNITNPALVSYSLNRKMQMQITREFVLGDTLKFFYATLKGRKIDFLRSRDSIAMKDNFIRKLVATKDAVYRFSAVSTIKIIMRYDSINGYKITQIKNISPQWEISCLNDDDRDAVQNTEDDLVKTPGDITANGMPDNDFDGVPDETNSRNGILNLAVVDKCKYTYGIQENQGCPASYFSSTVQVNAFVGFQANFTTINLSELNQLGYVDESGNDAIDVLQSSKGALRKPRLVTGIAAGGDIAFYIDKKRRNGISVGFGFSRFTVNYTLTSPIMYTYKASDGSDYYRRQITITNLNERVIYYVLNFPVLYNHRFHLGKRYLSSACFKLGPSLMLFKNTSDYDGIVNIGGIYQVDPAQNKIVYNDYLDPESSYNVYVTSAGINNQNSDPGAVSVFSQLHKNYDFTDDRSYRGKSKNLTRLAVAVNASFEVNRKITDALALKGGLYFIYAALPKKDKKYKPLDRTTDEYNSIFNSTAKSYYSTIGINAGLTYNF